MCGICGVVYSKTEAVKPIETVNKMMEIIAHRGPDDRGVWGDQGVRLGFARLSIIDLSTGNQPIANEDGSLVLVCNGEIFNHLELRETLELSGHRFKSHCDIEVILHLYEEYGVELLDHLDGQFAFALWDRNKKKIFAARDYFGIAPFYYMEWQGCLLFASEAKAILGVPGVPGKIDLTSLDQIITFPGLLSPRSAFSNISSLPAGHAMTYDLNGSIKTWEYWDLIYPHGSPESDKTEGEWSETLDRALSESIRLRLRSDVPLGLYLSGGLDSSLIAAKAKNIAPDTVFHSFSIDFPDQAFSEYKYQQLMVESIGSCHTNTLFHSSEITGRLRKAIKYAETPLKETYNTATMALAEAVRGKGIKVVLSGEGADEWFAGYVGYRFDKLRQLNPTPVTDTEKDIRRRLWGRDDIFYEKNYSEFEAVKFALYSDNIKGDFSRFSCCANPIVDHAKINGRSLLQVRSYLDFKLRICDHLVADHADKMSFSQSVEGRFPFLSRPFVDIVTKIPDDLKLNGYSEKYLLKKLARGQVSDSILNREKFSFVAPGTDYLMRSGSPEIMHYLSESTIKKHGVFDAHEVARLVEYYRKPGFRLNVPFETDLLIVVITTGMLIDEYRLVV